MKFFSDLFEAMEERRRRQNRVAASIFGIGCFGFIILAIIIGIVTTIMNAVETANVNQVYGQAYASACEPVPAGQESLDNLPDAASPRKILLLTSDTQRRDAWHNDLPVQWRAENEAEVALIGCIQTERLLIETCEYQRSSEDGDNYTVRIERLQYQSMIVLLNARNARRIDSITLMGEEPEACPEDDGKFSSSELRGSPVAWEAIAAWIEGYIFDT